MVSLVILVCRFFSVTVLKMVLQLLCDLPRARLLFVRDLDRFVLVRVGDGL